MTSHAGGRRRWMIVLGAAIIVASLVAATGLFLASSQRVDDVVAGFARAPAGCESRLDFRAPGTYYVFVETRGELPELSGDCDASGKIDRDDDLPEVDVTVTDPDGEERDLDDRGGIDYDTDDFAGVVVGTVDIEQPGDYLVTAAAGDDDEFLVAVGSNPDDAVSALRGAGLAVGLIGTIVGAVLIVVGARRRGGGATESPVSATPAWATPAWAPAVTPPIQQPPISAAPGPPQGPPLGPATTPPGYLPPPPPGPTPPGY